MNQESILKETVFTGNHIKMVMTLLVKLLQNSLPQRARINKEFASFELLHHFHYLFPYELI